MAYERIKQLTRRFGFEPKRWTIQTSPVLRRARVLEAIGVDLVLDVGANDGRYARELRTGGYGGQIISFEPAPATFRALEQAAAGDPCWDCRALALGDRDGDGELNLAGNSEASSFLPMAGSHIAVMPEAAYVGTVSVATARLDTFISGLPVAPARPFLKMDVQGFELKVLDGATATLPALAGVETEVGLVKLYEGQPEFRELFDRFEAAGFELVGLEPHFFDPRTGRTLQLDATFVRRGLLEVDGGGGFARQAR
jgi:FkbM family methyltransferase